MDVNPIRLAIIVVAIIVAVGIAFLLGDYLGYKIGRMKLATYVFYSLLGVIVAFAIYAAIDLLIIQ